MSATGYNWLVSNTHRSLAHMQKKYDDLYVLYQSVVRERDALRKEIDCARRGRAPVVAGAAYERRVHDVVRQCTTAQSVPMNTQSTESLGGSSSTRHDIVCNNRRIGDVPIEIKKVGTPDWVQVSLVHVRDGRWKASSRKTSVPDKCKQRFTDLLSHTTLFGGNVPPFIDRKMTHAEWVACKGSTLKYFDEYIACPRDTIAKMYADKGCKYIQVSGKGLYSLGDDVYGFGVPVFECDQRIRVRIKVHARNTKRGHCTLSVTAACQPVNVRSIRASQYSLDDESHLPPSVRYGGTLIV